MDFIVIGVNHDTAPVEIREQLAWSDADTRQALHRLSDERRLAESLLLATCNRTELYGVVEDVAAAETYIRQFLNRWHGVDYFTNGRYAYRYIGETAIRHLFRVAAGLDSMILGETQIFGQVKQAYQLSTESGGAGLFVNRLLHQAFRVGKRVRTETAIGAGAVSVSYAAVELAEKIFGHLGQRRGLLIGAGDTGLLTATHLRDKGIGHLSITSRTLEHAEVTARRMQAELVRFEDRESALKQCDIVISATSAPTAVVDRELMRRVMRHRPDRPIFFIDIAVPRDIDPAIGDLDNVFLHDIDDLKLIVDQNLAKRQAEIPRAEKIIAEEAGNMMAWLQSLAATPMIKALRHFFEEIRREELTRNRKHFPKTTWDQLDQFSRSLINKLLHVPTTRLREAVGEGHIGFVRLESVRDLFGLLPDQASGGDSSADTTDSGTDPRESST